MCLRMGNITPASCRLESKQDNRIEIEEVIKALAEKRFISPHPENNLTRAREWVRQHQREVDIICQLFPQPLDEELREKINNE